MIDENDKLNGDMTLYQYQCQKEGTLFYNQHGMKPIPSHIVEHCPVCGGDEVALASRKYPGLDERQGATRTICLAECGAADGNHDETLVLSAHTTREGAKAFAAEHVGELGLPEPDDYAIVREIEFVNDYEGAPCM